MNTPAPVERAPAGCGVQGCLFSAVALFVLLLVTLMVIAFFRFREPPDNPLGRLPADPATTTLAAAHRPAAPPAAPPGAPPRAPARLSRTPLC